jgi:hypothetical protein
MTAKEAIKEQELAAFHLAESERHSRAADKQRLVAARHLAAANLFFREALEQAELAREEKHLKLD